MIRTTLNIKIEFTQPVLGSASANPDLHAEFVASKAPTTEKSLAEFHAVLPPDITPEAWAALTEDERKAMIEEITDKKTTVFPRDNEGLFYYDYQIRGAIKGGILAMIELGEESVKSFSKWTYKRAVDGFVFVTPRQIYFKGPSGLNILHASKTLQRPLRAETMQGDRVCLASSEMLDVGTSLEFTVSFLSGTNKKSKVTGCTEDVIRDVLAYGSIHGLGQWRGGGWGTYRHSVEQLARSENLSMRDALDAALAK